ncbi:MAG: hypothetical protein H6741_20500 [Alphaproteobacteria bacterium]|nr:hypothetical protein [Alphaproteobacteria bacterium]MCB9795089.1 hypothetical protein [Alphaproteobacteria bacterium]
MTRSLIPLAALTLFAGLSAAPAQAAVRGKVKASSVKVDEADRTIKQVADKAVDGLLQSGWAEGEDGYGEGSWLELDLGQTVEVKEVNLWPGNLSQGKKSFREYSRPRKVTVTLSGAGEPVVKEVIFQDRIQRFDLELDEAVQARKVRIDIVEVYEGFVFSDLYMAEVAVNFRQSKDELADFIDWYNSDEAIEDQAEHEEAIRTAFQAIMDAEFGDRDSLRFIMDQAGDGPNYVREVVTKKVDVGYRAAAVRPDTFAIDALRKLKDANSIPAIEMALLRSWGKRAEELEELVEIFYAYQTLIGGPNLNTPYWGQSGWWPGAIQSFKEPVPIEINVNGDLYIADIGNNRVERFNYQGAFDREWGGGEADITNQWFDRGREWYVTGQKPGDGAGEFINPLDVELIPMGDEGEGFAVLDTTMRVQVFDDQGRPMIGWPVQSNSQLDPGVGGEGYLAWIPKKKWLFVFLGNEAVAFTLDAQEVARWEIEDGTPNAVEVSKKGKLYLAFGTDVVRYEVDGFRFGVIWSTDQLGLGFEDLDITIDEDKRIWIVTDQGWAYKYKNERKLEYAVRFSEVSLIRPRIAVQEDILYCVDRDRIIRLDALQAKIDAEEAAAAAAEGEGAGE